MRANKLNAGRGWETPKPEKEGLMEKEIYPDRCPWCGRKTIEKVDKPDGQFWMTCNSCGKRWVARYRTVRENVKGGKAGIN